MRSPYTEHAASWLPNPTRLEGKVRFFQARPAGYHTLSEIVTKCLLTSSMLIKMQDHSIAIQPYGGFIDSLCL